MPRDGRRHATMTDVARESGASLKTVSRVINGVTTVDPVLAERVRSAARELGFQPNQLAASLRSGGATRTVGIVIKDMSNEFYGGIAAAAADVAARRGWRLITAHSGENLEEEAEVILDLCRRRVDGLVIVPTSGDHAFLEPGLAGIPVVFIDREAQGLEADSVVIDSAGGARDGVEALLADGHTRIAAITDTLRMQTMRERLDGVREALVGAGLTLDERLVVTEINTPGPAAEAAAAMLDGDDPPTAFFCGSNMSARGVLQLLWERRRDDVGLVCFDDFALAALMPRPLLCVSYSVRELGELAAEQLFRRIEGDTSAPQHVVVPTRVIERGIRADALAERSASSPASPASPASPDEGTPR